MADDYATHYAVLAAVVARGKGSVLELGAGEGSTPMLHYLCKALGIGLWTCESNFEWLKRFMSYKTAMHGLDHVLDWNYWMETQGRGEWGEMVGRRFGCAFVDCAPGEMRTPLIKWLKGKAVYIVVHDTETDYATGANYKYEEVKPLFKYVTEFQRWRPYTMILSDDAPFEIDECDKVWVPNAAQQEYYTKMGITK